MTLQFFKYNHWQMANTDHNIYIKMFKKAQQKSR